MTLLVHFLLLFGDVKLPEEVERDDGVDVDDDGQQHDGQYELLAVVRDGLEDDAQGRDTDGHVEQVGSEEEVVVVAQDGEDKVQQLVDEWLQVGANLNNWRPMWPDSAKFATLAKFWRNLAIVKGLFSIWQYYNLLCQISRAIGLIFIAVNGQKSKN